MKERVRIKKPRQFEGETGVVLWFNEETNQVCVKFDRSPQVVAIFTPAELQYMGVYNA